ncbi:MAG: glycosyltransferase family 39 protein, partial [Microgenomates group bacterium]
MTKNKSSLLALILITLLGLILRFWQLDKFPVSLNWDEVSHGYNAYSILTTGKDEWGTAFPLIFRAFGDYKLPVYIYLTIIPVFLFGLNAFAVRFISALAGVIAIPLVYFLAREIFPDRKHIGLVAAALLAFSPWHFFISRPALEANLALTLTIAGALFLLLGLKKTFSYLPSAISLALALHTYNTARVFVPLLLLAFIFIYRKAIKIDFKAALSLLLVIFSLAIVINQVAVGTGTA